MSESFRDETDITYKIGGWSVINGMNYCTVYGKLDFSLLVSEVSIISHRGVPRKETLTRIRAAIDVLLTEPITNKTE